MKTLRKPTLVMLLAAMLLAGCVKEVEPTPESESNDTVGHFNPYAAEDTPLSEHFLPEFEFVFRLHPNLDGTFYALADGEKGDFLLKLDNNGYVQQRVELGYQCMRSILNTGGNIILLGNLGYVDSPFNMSSSGYVAVYDQNMQLTATLTLSEPQYKIEIYSIIQDSHNPNVFYVGGAAVDDSYQQHPYLCTLQFSEGLMTKVSSKIYTDRMRNRIIGMVEKSENGQHDLILETIHYSLIDSPYDANRSSVHIVKLNYFEESTGWGATTWDVPVIGLHGDSYTRSNSIDSDENNVYFFGLYCDDKEPAPASNGYWDSGCVAAINWHQGQLTWSKTISLTNKDEHLYYGFLSGGYLYACGGHSGLYYLKTQKSFSNGLVVKISLSGELVTYKTFGDPERSSYLHHMVKDTNGNLVCVGESNENLGDGKKKYSGWFLKTDMSNATHKTFMDAPLNQQEEMLDVILSAGCDESISIH